MAPPTGLEPVTSWLTVMRSTDWAMEEYTIFFGLCQRFLLRLHKEQSFLLLKSPVVDLNNIFNCSSGQVIVSSTFLYTRTTDWAMEEYSAKHPIRCFACVGISLFFQAVTSQVFSAPLSLTSVFGMGTGGPSASSTPTILLYLFFPYLRSLYHLHGDSCGNRTRVAGVRGRSLNRLTNEPSVCNKG